MLTKIDLMDKGTDAVDVSLHAVSSILDESIKGLVARLIFLRNFPSGV